MIGLTLVMYTYKVSCLKFVWQELIFYYEWYIVSKGEVKAKRGIDSLQIDKALKKTKNLISLRWLGGICSVLGAGVGELS